MGVWSSGERITDLEARQASDKRLANVVGRPLGRDLEHRSNL
jgi:hypothetical protein